MATTKISYYLSKLQSYGLRSSDILRDTGIDIDDVQDMSLSLSAEQYRKLIKNILELTGDTQIGLKLGASCSLSDLGVMGYAILSSKTVKMAGEIIHKYSELNEKILILDDYNKGDYWCIELQETFPLGSYLQFVVEEYVSRIQVTLSQLINGPAGLVELHFSYSKPESIQRYEELFDCPCYFDQPKNLIYIDQSVLDKPVSLANDVVNKLCEEQCTKLVRELNKSSGLADKVRNYIYSNPGSFPNTDGMAEVMQMHTRSLRRQLQLEGTTYQSILDKAREKLAIDWLKNTDITPKEIGFMLGYSDVGNFRRAFRTWTGKKVSDFRR